MREGSPDDIWKGYLSTQLATPVIEPAWNSPERRLWDRFMRRDCLDLASVIGMQLRLPVGRLRKGRQLAHAFVILPGREAIPDRWPCLDWAGVRTLKAIRDDMRVSWGRLAFDDADLTPIAPHELSAPRSEVLRHARTRPHVTQAMRMAWPRLSNRLERSRLRYLDVVDVRTVPRQGRPRRRDVIDLG